MKKRTRRKMGKWRRERRRTRRKEEKNKGDTNIYSVLAAYF